MLALVLVCGNHAQSTDTESTNPTPNKISYCPSVDTCLRLTGCGACMLITAAAAGGAGYVWYNYLPHWAQVTTGVIAGVTAGSAVTAATVVVVGGGLALLGLLYTGFKVSGCGR